MKHTTMIAGMLLSAALIADAASAGETVQVTIHGTVAFNGIGALPLSSAGSGEDVSLSFTVDSDVFTDSPSFPTRGYHIDTSSFALTTDTHVVGLQNPFPGGSTPYFVLRDNDPAVDGFLVSDVVDSPSGVPLGQNGNFGPFGNDFYVTYGGTTLPSLDILDAVGSYDFTGLTVYNWVIEDGPFEAAFFDFASMTIEVLAERWSDLGQGLAGTNGLPSLQGLGSLVGGTPVTLGLTNARPNATSYLVVGVGTVNLPFYGGTLIPEFQAPNGLFLTLVTNGAGNLLLNNTWPTGLPSGLAITFQHWIVDPLGPFGFAASNGLTGTTP